MYGLNKNSVYIERGRFLTQACYLIPFFTSLSFLIIWFFLPAFKEFAGLNMKCNTAVGLFCASIALWLLSDEEKLTPKKNRIAKALIAIVFLIGALTQLQYSFGFNFGIDEFFAKDIFNEESKMFPGRMSPNASMAFISLSLGLWLLDTYVKNKSIHPASILLLLLNISTLFSILGYLYDEKIFYKIGPYIRVSLPSSISFWLLSIGALLARPQAPLIKIFFSEGLGGVTARRLVPFITILPIIFNYLRLRAYHTGLLSFELGLSLYVMALILFLVGAIVFTSLKLDQIFFKKKDLLRKENIANERLSLVIDATKIGTFEYDQQNHKLLWNHYHEVLFGYEPGHPQRSLEDFTRRLHPDDLAFVFENFERTLKEKTIHEVEFRIILPSQEIRWIHARANHEYNSDGHPSLMRGTVMDITDLKLNEQKIRESEEKFRTITNAMPQMVWSTLSDGNADYFNDQWYAYTGAKEGETNGTKWLDFIHPDEHSKVLKSWNESLMAKTLYQIKYRLKNRSGEYHWVLARAIPIKNQDNEIIRWMGTSTDIEDIKKASDQLAASLSARDEFLSITSHELKTPLTALRLQADLLKRSISNDSFRKLSDAQLTQIVEQTDRQISRLNRLINDMLDVTRIRSGQLSIEKERLDLKILAEETIERLRGMFVIAKAEVPILLPCESIYGYWDKMRIEQVLTNLLTNALRYGEGKPITVHIQKYENKVQLSVKDQGVGIEKKHHQKIFDRFERASMSNEAQGLGLGLFIVKELVAVHGGRIWLESEIGKGSSFFVELPLE